jgi:Trypsin-like peptidase domain
MKPRRKWTRCGAILVLLGILFRAHLLSASPIVTVVATLQDSGLDAFGSGFVSSPDGDVLTCYHVVVGASKIQVVYNNRLLAAEARAISPERDIARLHITSAPLPMEHLQVQFDLPPNLASQQLEVRGYVAGLFDATIQARAIQNSFVLTDQLRDTHRKNLFAVQGVKIIPLTITVFKGMSGAPLIDNGLVIGIISGSLTEGGSLGWAIAMVNARAEYLTTVEAPRAGFVWPKLKLMADGWGNLRRQSPIGESLLQKIGVFLESIDTADHLREETCAQLSPIESNASETLRIFDRHQQLLGLKLADLTSTQEGQDFKKQLDMSGDELGTAIRNWGATRNLYLSSLVELSQSIPPLVVEVRKFTNDLPMTSKNAKLSSDVHQQLGKNQDEMQKLAANLPDQSDHGPKAEILVSDLRDYFIEAHKLLISNQDEYCHLTPEFLASFRDDGRIVKELLGADAVSVTN